MNSSSWNCREKKKKKLNPSRFVTADLCFLGSPHTRPEAQRRHLEARYGHLLITYSTSRDTAIFPPSHLSSHSSGTLPSLVSFTSKHNLLITYRGWLKKNPLSSNSTMYVDSKEGRWQQYPIWYLSTYIETAASLANALPTLPFKRAYLQYEHCQVIWFKYAVNLQQDC